MRWRWRSPAAWIAALLWRSYWGMATAAVIVALPIIALLLVFDGAGASQAVAGLGWPFAFGADGAQQLASGLVTTYAALVALYFSISLLVLTLAAGNLGVRLIDLWISKRPTRITLALLLVGMVWSLIALMAVGPDHAIRLTLVALMAFSVPVLCWLSYALHDLGRTMHVDTAVTQIARGAVRDAEPPPTLAGGGPAPDWDDGMPVRATRDGYVEAIALKLLARHMARSGGRLRVDTQLGAYVLTGDRLATAVGCDAETRIEAAHAFAIGDFRSATQGAVFKLRLLVEIAARALSPAVNDFYTARACVDALGPVLIAHGWQDQAARWFADDDGEPRLLLPANPFAQLFDGPLHALRQAAADYPTIAIRLLHLYGRLLSRDLQPPVADLIVRHRALLADHAAARAEAEVDRAAIRAAAIDAGRTGDSG